MNICRKCGYTFAAFQVRHGVCDACRIQNDLHGDLLLCLFVGILVFGGILTFILSGGTLDY